MRLWNTLEKNKGNIKRTSRRVSCSRNTVRSCKRSESLEEWLSEKSRKPINSPLKTDPQIEKKVLKLRDKTNLGRIRLTDELDFDISPFTVRNILRRNKREKPNRQRGVYKGLVYYNLDALYPFEQFQIDLKEILDIKSLPYEVYTHALRHSLPVYQWTAIDIKTRVRFMAYSYEKSHSNGLLFQKAIIYWLRSFGISHNLTFQTDWGEEFGGKSLAKLDFLQREVFTPLGVRLTRIRKGKSTDNGYVERSHRTDDEEFYRPYLSLACGEREFIRLAAWWEYTYNTLRKHYGKGLYGITPFEKLRQYYPWAPKQICLFPTIILDYVSGSRKLNTPYLTGGQHVLDNYILFDKRVLI